MTGSGLASAIQSGMSFPTLSPQLTAFGNCIVAEIQANAQVNNASASVTATCPSSGGAISNGAATGGIISGLSGSRLASAFASAAGYGSVSADLLNECDEICTHIMSAGMVAFALGDITGTSANTPLSAGTVTGAGAGGTISGLDGPTLANLIHVANGYPGSVSAKLTANCVAICNYIQSNASVSYASGNVTGIAPAGGGSMANGTGVNGTTL